MCCMQICHSQTRIIPAFQHVPGLDFLLCGFGVEPADLRSGEAEFISHNRPLKTQLAGDLLHCLQVDNSILEKTQQQRQAYFCDKGFKKKKINTLMWSAFVTFVAFIQNKIVKKTQTCVPLVLYWALSPIPQMDRSGHTQCRCLQKDFKPLQFLICAWLWFKISNGRDTH